MKSNKRYIKFVLLSIVALTMSFLVFYIIQNHDSLDFQEPLDQNVLVDTSINENFNMVFYKKNCPYCQAGKTQVEKKSDSSAYPTYWIDLNTDEGQILKMKYGVKYAATIVQVRRSKIKIFSYATKKDNKIIADSENITEAFQEKKYWRGKYDKGKLFFR